MRKIIATTTLLASACVGEVYESTHTKAEPPKYDLHYGDHPKQTYDYYKGEGNKYLYVWLHGGAWHHRGVAKNTYKKELEEFHALHKDVSIINMNYRLVENNSNSIYVMNAQTEDVKTLLSLYRNKFEVIILGGHSAGGHLAWIEYLRGNTLVDGINPVASAYDANQTDTDGKPYINPERLGEWIIPKFIDPELREEDTREGILTQFSPRHYYDPNRNNIYLVNNTSDNDVPMHQYNAVLEDYPNIKKSLYNGGHWAYRYENGNRQDWFNNLYVFITQI